MTQSMEWEIDKDEKQGHRKKKILTQHLPAQGIMGAKRRKQLWRRTIK